MSASLSSAEKLFQALRSGRSIEPLGLSMDAAYATAAEVIRLRDEPRVGFKIGVTSKAVQEMLGIDAPTWGTLTEPMRGGGTRIHPKIEAEIAFVLGTDLVAGGDVLAATESVHVALEIADSRIADWKISAPDHIADNASGSGFVLGPPAEIPNDLKMVKVAVELDGELVGEGVGANALGDPVACVAWLAEALGTIPAGSIIISGALHKPVPVVPGQSVVVRSSLGELRFTV